MRDIKGKIAWVTGAGSGIGEAAAKALAAEGCIVILTGVCITLVGLSKDSLFGTPLGAESELPDQIFYLCGALIGAAGGVLQAASRTMMVYHADRGGEAEAFGLYGLCGKATTFLAPALITVATLAMGSARYGIAPLVPLLLTGLVLLFWVRPYGDRMEGEA